MEADRATTSDGRGNTLGLTHLLVDMWIEQGPELSVIDAGTVYEQPNATLDFRVTLDPPSNDVVTVDYLAWGNTQRGAGRGRLREDGRHADLPAWGHRDDGVGADHRRFGGRDGRVREPGHPRCGPGRTSRTPKASGMITNSELVARFLDVPAAHDGSGAFAFRVEFSEDIAPLGGESFTVGRGPRFRSAGSRGRPHLGGHGRAGL